LRVAAYLNYFHLQVIGHGRTKQETAPMSELDSLTHTFRLAMRRFASTVSVVSTLKDGARHAMTATAVTSLSMEPPSLLVCVYRGSRFHRALHTQERFCVNILHKDQAEASQTFSRPASAEDFDRFGWIDSNGYCYLADAQATVFCTVSQQVTFGTHTIFIGTVGNATVRNCVAPLIFQNGQYGVHAPLTGQAP
jgi:flavin reductase (DIM6/NTAB) family NADH-FMN oxidoreductase RutF